MLAYLWAPAQRFYEVFVIWRIYILKFPNSLSYCISVAPSRLDRLSDKDLVVFFFYLYFRHVYFLVKIIFSITTNNSLFFFFPKSKIYNFSLYFLNDCYFWHHVIQLNSFVKRDYLLNKRIIWKIVIFNVCYT